MKDQNTSKSRGFCYITFKDLNSINNILNIKTHFIGNTKLECKQITNDPNNNTDIIDNNEKPNFIKSFDFKIGDSKYTNEIYDFNIDEKGVKLSISEYFKYKISTSYDVNQSPQLNLNINDLVPEYKEALDFGCIIRQPDNKNFINKFNKKHENLFLPFKK